MTTIHSQIIEAASGLTDKQVNFVCSPSNLDSAEKAESDMTKEEVANFIERAVESRCDIPVDEILEALRNEPRITSADDDVCYDNAQIDHLLYDLLPEMSKDEEKQLAIALLDQFGLSVEVQKRILILAD